MLPFEFIGNLLSFNVQWFVELIMNNLLWLFVFVLATYVNHDMQWSWKSFFVITFYIWLNITFFPEIGVVFLVGGFFFLLYVGRIILITFTETVPSLKGRVAPIMAIHFLATLFYYNFFVI